MIYQMPMLAPQEFRSRKVDELTGKLQHALLRLLSRSVQMATEAHNDEEIKQAVDIATRAFVISKDLPKLEQNEIFHAWKATAFQIAMLCQARNYEIGGIQVRFKENLEVLIPGATLKDFNSDRKHIPDAWIELEGQMCPVEVKRRAFDRKAVSQLCRYMRFYGCNRGFAVAPKLSAKLAPGMKFVQLD